MLSWSAESAGFLLILELVVVAGAIALAVFAPALARVARNRRREPISRRKELWLIGALELFAVALVCLALSGVTYGSVYQLIFAGTAIGSMIVALFIGLAFG